MSISSSELRQRKATTASPAIDHEKDDLKKQKLLVKPTHKTASSNDAFVALALFIVSLPIRFKHISHPDQVV